MENSYDFVAVGDIVTEPFIRLKDAHIHSKLDQVNEELCLRFGDKVPYESAEIIRAVGNSANAAVCAARLGASSYLLSYIGDDEIGKGNIEELKLNNVHTDFVKVEPGYQSNYHYVLWYGVERTILVKHTEFPYAFPMDLPPPKWMYLSSLASNTEKYHEEIAEYLALHPEVKLAYQPGTFQMKLGIEKTKAIYERTELFFVNVEEAQRILGTTESDKKVLMDSLAALGPKLIVMTDGIEGAYLRKESGEKFFMPIFPHTPVERTGAGDAFASTITAALSLGKTLEEAFLWAPVNAMSVTQFIGAQKGLLSQEKITEYLKDAPLNYTLQKLP